MTINNTSEGMSHVGFRDIRTQPLDDVHTAVIGIKVADD